MTIKIQRGRQFSGGSAATALFDSRGRLGAWLPNAANKLVTQQIALKLKDSAGAEVSLTTKEEWSGFLRDNASTATKSKAFAEKFGISFQDFIELVDDAAMSEEKGLTLDLTPGGKLAESLSLDKMDNDYAAKLTKGQKVQLDGTTAAGAQAEIEMAMAPTIGPDILANPVGGSWDRDRAEQESWADFKTGNGASKIFKANTGPAPFAKLTDPQWKDDEAVALASKFNMPIHAQLDDTTPHNPDGTPNFQDHYEMFREVYFDDRNGTLGKVGASVRARVRFDNNEPYEVRRVLVQAKEGREVDPQTGRSIVHKFEKRWEGNSVTEAGAQAALMTGRDSNGSVLPVSQKLYKLAKDNNALPADGNLRLEPKHLVLQKRRRAHLQIDTLSDVQKRQTAVKAEIDAAKAANQPVDPKLQAWSDKLDKQVASMQEASTLLSKYGKYMPSGECIIVSADKYAVYDPAARAGKAPNDDDDELGQVGKGLHVEAEWDSASSDPFTEAVEKIDEQLKSNPANAAELQADKEKLNGIREQFRQDVATAVELMKSRLVGAGMELDDKKLSKDDRAKQMMAESKNRPTYWL